jgi:hypothetical protein
VRSTQIALGEEGPMVAAPASTGPASRRSFPAINTLAALAAGGLHLLGAAGGGRRGCGCTSDVVIIAEAALGLSAAVVALTVSLGLPRATRPGPR